MLDWLLKYFTFFIDFSMFAIGMFVTIFGKSSFPLGIAVILASIGMALYDYKWLKNSKQ